MERKMANYYTDASFILSLSTIEQKAFALQVLSCVSDENVNLLAQRKSDAAKKYDNAVFRIAKKLVSLELDNYENDCFDLGFAFSEVDSGIWIHHDETINMENAAFFCQLILRHFKLDASVCINASHTCSKPRLDAFGGHACFVTRHAVKWFSTDSWLDKQISQYKKRLEKKQVT